jgi:hypothetical protein
MTFTTTIRIAVTTALVAGAVAPAALAAGEPKNEWPFTGPVAERTTALALASAKPTRSGYGEPKSELPFTRSVYRSAPRGAAPVQSDVISRYLISHSAVRPDDRAGPLGVGSDSAVGIVTPAHSVILDSTGFQWSDAGIGAGTALGLILLALGATVLVRSGRVRSA